MPNPYAITRSPPAFIPRFGTRTESGGESKKIEPIRNMGAKVSRNDPCPCGSGKKYKNCHMKLEARN